MMSDTRTNAYAFQLAKLIQAETVSSEAKGDRTKFYQFHDLLRKTFPRLFAVCEFEDFNGSILMRWKGKTEDSPVMLMNHHDVVEAPGEWKYPPFSGTIAEGRVWGRGTLDNKGGLWAMLQAAEELAEEGFVPRCDVYFVSTCMEECDGSGADSISLALMERGIRFSMVLDEGGMILQDPIGGADGTYAMVGLGEKGCVDLKFIARSAGGHASTPERDTPLVRLGKFMAEVDRGRIFETKLSPTVCAMFSEVSKSMRGYMKLVLGHPRLFAPILTRVIPQISNVAAAMLKTTVAFTMASGSEGANVLPQEAWVMGNMRYSHHQGGKASVDAIVRLAEKYNIETVILDPGFDSPLSDHRSEAFALVERAVAKVFPGVRTSPYVMTGASDCRYMSRISENCLRFAPFKITHEQMDSIHGVNENVDLSALAPAVDFYKYIMKEV